MTDEVVVRETEAISTKLHMWSAWMKIAVIHVAAARCARGGLATPLPFESTESARLSEEFEAALVAVVAVSFAMDALDNELKTNGGHRSATPPARTDGTKHNRGDWASQCFIEVFGITPPFSIQLYDHLHRLFDLRNTSVHFESIVRVGLQPHPSGTKTTAELAIFTLEAGEDAMKVGRELIAQCAAAVSASVALPASASIARDLPDVLTMIDDVTARP